MALGKVLYQSAAPRDVFTAPVLRAHRAALGQARPSLFMALGKVLHQSAAPRDVFVGYAPTQPHVKP